MIDYIVMGINEKILQVKDIIENSRALTVLTGAGISAESGIPTFRGKEGLWKNYSPQQLASPEAFRNDPQMVWEWYDWRRDLISKAQPNAGHSALAVLEKEHENFTLITQNVDGLHSSAGSRNVVEIHGNIWEIRCTACSRTEKNYEVPLSSLPPRCSKCGEITRPNTVWFGEVIPMSVIDRCIIAVEQADAMLVIGTSGLVEPAASLGLMAKQSGKKVIEINPEPSVNTGFYDITIESKAGEILPLLYSINKTMN